MLALDRVMTNAGTQALAEERSVMRVRRAVAFMRRHFGPRIAHLDEAALTHYAEARMSEFARLDLNSEQDQLSAFALAIHWGPDWLHDHMPLSMMPHAGKWIVPQTPGQKLAQSLAALDIWHTAFRDDLANRARAATVLHELYTKPRVIASRGRDPHEWCAVFAPQLWSLMSAESRYGHCGVSAAIASRYLPSFQDEILFACIGLVLGVRFSDNPLYPQFQAALTEEEDREPDQIRIALGEAIADYWQQISKDE